MGGRLWVGKQHWYTTSHPGQWPLKSSQCSPVTQVSSAPPYFVGRRNEYSTGGDFGHH